MAARSDVFKAMFNHNFTENRERVLVIKDMSIDAAREFLRYIYCGEIKHLSCLAEQLFFAAEKYNLQHLKARCELALCWNLNVRNLAMRADQTRTIGADRANAYLSHMLASNSDMVLGKKCYLLRSTYSLY